MAEFYVTIQLRVRAGSSGEACEFGIAAAEHLLDTFNDNETIDPLVSVDALPIETRKD